MSASAISRLSALRGRGYATSASGLNATSLAKAKQLSADWKGTSLVGGTTKNYIGGEFVDSKADKWLEIHDPVCLSVFSFTMKKSV
jgi:malonate-semialdehyde dehydrogenase (acetylating)/methylmalonate-semialdehyde dehydrogenase